MSGVSDCFLWNLEVGAFLINERETQPFKPPPATTPSLFPGVGKTTLVLKASEALRSSGLQVEGFYTEEVREGAGRIGFDVVTVRGERGRLARLR